MLLSAIGLFEGLLLNQEIDWWFSCITTFLLMLQIKHSKQTLSQNGMFLYMHYFCWTMTFRLSFCFMLNSLSGQWFQQLQHFSNNSLNQNGNCSFMMISLSEILHKVIEIQGKYFTNWRCYYFIWIKGFVKQCWKPLHQPVMMK